jgi:hypothetical protein
MAYLTEKEYGRTTPHGLERLIKGSQEDGSDGITATPISSPGDRGACHGRRDHSIGSVSIDLPL